MMDEWKLVLMYILVVFTLIVGSILVMDNYAYGKTEIKYKEKICFLTVQKGEMAWCYFGDEDEPNVRGNSIEIKNNPHIIDQFLYFLETGISRDNE